jgi:hypothetical protein
VPSAQGERAERDVLSCISIRKHTRIIIHKCVGWEIARVLAERLIRLNGEVDCVVSRKNEALVGRVV